MTNINASEVIARLQNGEHLNLLDVRGEMEFHTFNIGGRNIPLPHLADNLDDLDWNKTDEIIVICKAGLRSTTAKSILTLKRLSKYKELNRRIARGSKKSTKTRYLISWMRKSHHQEY